MKITFTNLSLIGAIYISAIGNSSVQAQVTPDGTLNTAVSSSNSYNITGGTVVSNNLFHSFSQFSIPTGGSATFSHNSNIQNIFSRVTGNSISYINGSINTNSGVNLFLLNPAGIIFGANASLNVGGSFVGTTANSIQFADGNEFSTNITKSPLLTMSVPVGLQLGGNPGTISVQGVGNNSRLNPTTSVSGLTSTNGLQVLPEKTLALIGGDLVLDSSFLSAPGGRIELGSITQGSANIHLTPQALTFSYPSIGSSFGNIQMSQGAVASVRGTSPGSIQLQGKQLDLQDGSLLVVQNLGNSKAGDITVNATESLQVVGKSADFRSSSGIVNEVLLSGTAGNIVITTPTLTIDRGAIVMNRSYNSARGGNITINANAVSVGGVDPKDPSTVPIFGVLVAAAFGTKQGGDLSISTDSLSILGGANVGTRSFSSGQGGNVKVTADTVNVSSLDSPPGSLFISLLSANTFGPGDAGDLHLDTRKLSIQDGGLVSVSSVSSGNAGNLTINATESIDVRGMKDAENPSYIGAIARLFLVRTSTNISNNSTSKANAGSVTINTPKLTIRDGARVFVENEVQGDAGTLNVNANTLYLNNSSLSASTKAGQGGNINLQLRDYLLIRNGSFINSEAGAAGNGGNITINSPIILAWKNSDIIANAFQGKGGNIDITTQGIFGLEYRPQLTPENDITASSQFGVNGTVNVNTIGFDPNSGLVELPVNVSDSSQKIATGCANSSGSSFVATGRGGIPQNPTQEIMSDRTWSDIRDISAFHTTQPVKAQIQKSPEILVQATSWRRNAQGKIELISNQSPNQVQTALTCAATSQN
ncbi:filamentous hemagglutinin N-terminal domain-containing protein [Nostoc sp. LEGE 12450]|uniref:two-partner secretion domain-containing protein n=1 Tax=Nostoc sp. LEGE 12450 TaxID=1828643 RepID=UPI00187FFB0F|nr:S-layer family protein [Nostoc sp. LEGE 12450]MBE8985755.1 S-layer family protein [Nostoc sp. LEGE 12450]